MLFSSTSSLVIQSLSLLEREVFHIIYASLKKVLCFVLRKVFGRLVEILWFILFYSSSLSLQNLLYPHLSIPYEHLYNINVLLGNPLIFFPSFLYSASGDGFFYPALPIQSEYATLRACRPYSKHP